MCDAPSDRGRVQTESEFQSYLTSCLEAAEWEVRREVSPDTGSGRVDIIATHSEIGTIGIETKVASASGPRETGAALQQLLSTYVGREYDGETVDAWGVAVHGDGLFTTDSTDFAPHAGAYQFACQRIVNRLGIGWVVEHVDTVRMEFAASTPALRVPLFETRSTGEVVDPGACDCDLQRVRDVVADRVPARVPRRDGFES